MEPGKGGIETGEKEQEEIPLDFEKKYQEALAALHKEGAIPAEIHTEKDIREAFKAGANTTEELKNYIKNKEIEFTRKTAEITLARVKDYKELWAETKQKGEEKFIQKTKEVWKEFVVHGVVRKHSETGEIMILNFTDLDGKCSLALLHLAGMNTRDLKYVAPGESIPGRINLDTGERYGLVVEDEGKTAFLDHHTDEAGRESSATQITYETLVKNGLLKKEKHLDKLVEFVTQIDNNNFPEAEKYFRDSWQMMLGLNRFVQPEKLIEFFKDGKNPTDILSREDLEKYGLLYTVRGKKIDRSIEQKESVEKSWQQLKRMEREGWIIDSDRYGKIAVDVGNRVSAGANAAEAYGCDSYIIWDPKEQSFFISTNRKLTDEFPQGEKIRDSMWIKPRLDNVPLTLSLEEVLGKMTDGKFKMTPEQKAVLKKPEIKKEPLKPPEGFDLSDLEKARKVRDEKGGYPWVSEAEKARDFLIEEIKKTEEEIQKAQEEETKKGLEERLKALSARWERLKVLSSEELGGKDKELNESSFLKYKDDQNKGKPERGKEEYNDEARIELLIKLTEEIPEEKKEKETKVVPPVPPEPEKKPEEEKKEVEKPERDLKIVEEELNNLRVVYLEAKRIAGNWRRRGEVKVKIKGEEKTFKNKEVVEALPQIGEEYDRLCAEYRRLKVKKDLENYQGENLKEAITKNLLAEYETEGDRVEKLVEQRKKSLATRFKEWYRRHPYARMGLGYALSIGSVATVATGQLWLTPWLISGRAALAGVSTAVGTEAALARYSKKLGERGIAGKKTLAELEKLSPEEMAQRIKKEITALTALQERKGVKLEKAGPREAIISALRASDREIMQKTLEEAMEKGEQDKQKLLALALNSKFDQEIRERNAMIEKAGEEERVKSIRRWKYSALLGAIVGGLTAGWGFYRAGFFARPKAAAAPMEPEAPKPAPETLEITAGRGDSVWKMAEKALAQKYGENFAGLPEAERTYITDYIKDRIAENPAAFGLKDVDVVKIGQKIDFSRFLENDPLMKSVFSHAKNLTPEQMENILKNNELLRAYHKAHPDVFLDSEKVNEILSGQAKDILETPAKPTPSEVGIGKTMPQEAAAAPKTPAPGVEATETTPAPKATPEETEATPSPEPPKPAPSPEVGTTDEIDLAGKIAVVRDPKYPAEKLLKDFLDITKDKPNVENIRETSKELLFNIDKDSFTLESQGAEKTIEYITKRIAELGQTAPNSPEELEKAILEKTSAVILGRMGE